MIAVMIADISAWMKRGSRTTLSVMAVLLMLTAGITFFRPEAICEAFALVAVGVALQVGEEKWGNPELWKWVSHGSTPPNRIMIGKGIAVLFLLLLHAVVVLPLFIMAAMVWGVPFGNFLWVLLILAVAGETAMTIGLTLHYFRDQNRYIGSIMTLGWLVGTAIVDWLHPLNPFIQIWRAVSSAHPVHHGIYLIAHSVFMIAMLSLVGWKLRREVI